MREFGGDLYSLPASKWHWRSRVAALTYAHTLPPHHNYKLEGVNRVQLFIWALLYSITLPKPSMETTDNAPSPQAFYNEDPCVYV